MKVFVILWHQVSFPWDNVAYNIAVGKYGGQEIDKIVSFP